MDFSLIKDHPVAAAATVIIGGGGLFLLTRGKKTASGPTPVMIPGADPRIAQMGASLQIAQLQAGAQTAQKTLQWNALTSINGQNTARDIAIQQQRTYESAHNVEQLTYRDVNAANQSANSAIRIQEQRTYGEVNGQNQMGYTANHAQDIYQNVSLARVAHDNTVASAAAVYTQPSYQAPVQQAQSSVITSNPPVSTPVSSSVNESGSGGFIGTTPVYSHANGVSLGEKSQDWATAFSPNQIANLDLNEIAYLKQPRFASVWQSSDLSSLPFGANANGTPKTYQDFLNS